MTIQETFPLVQPVRLVDKNGIPYNPSNTIHLIYYSDPSSGNNIIFLDPLRIVAAPDITLDIVVKGQLDKKEPSMAQRQETLPDASQENNTTSTVSNPNASTTRVRRNPAGGLVEKAMDAYRDNENPAFGSRLRGPQALVDATSSSPANDTPPTPQESTSGTVTPSPQGSDSSSSNDFSETMKMAKLGDMDTQYTLGVFQNHTAAMEWYRKAADQGSTDAQYNIGVMYHKGLGVSKDYSAAVEWYLKASDQGFMELYRKATDQGLSSAQFDIGMIFEAGRIVPKDITAAEEWYKKAAAGGHGPAQVRFNPSSGKDIILWEDIIAAFKTNDVIHVRSGTVVLPFLKGTDFKSLDPLRIAAVHGVTLDVVIGGQLSQKELSMVSLQESLPDTPQKIGTATNSNTTTTTTVTAAVRRNPVGGIVEVAMDAYRNNENPAFGPKLRGPQALVDETSSSRISDTRPTSQKPTPRSVTLSPQGLDSISSNDFHEAMKMAILGDKDAQHAIAEMYFSAKGVQRDYQAAMEWYIQAANQEHAGAQNDIGFMYEVGLGVPQDYAAAMNWYQKASDQGSAAAQYNIGFMYRYGLGVSQDYSAAMEWYLKAANKGHSEALNNIGELYDNGLGVPQSDSLTMEWYRKAADQGSSIAQYNVGMMFEIGQGVPIDIEEAKEWYRKADAGGHTGATEKFNKLEHNGEEQKQDTRENNRRLGLPRRHSD
ncbi:hypothetical protein EC991_007647 [Linnemannia zychae]|nr:hypothetical protein EC991_007647 [Linnemannia zychae]